MTENLWIITISTLPSGQYHLTKSARSHFTLCKIRTGIRNYERQQLSDFDGVETVGHWDGWCATCKAQLPKRRQMIDQSVYEDAIRRAARLLTIATFDDPADLADVEFIFEVADEIEEKTQLPKKEAK